MKQRVCPRCGSKLEEDSIFCSECGFKMETEVDLVQDRETTNNNNNFSRQGKGKGSRLKIGLVLISVAIIIFAAYQLKGYFKPSKTTKSETTKNSASASKATTTKTGSYSINNIDTKAAIDFSKLIVEHDGFSVNSKNASVISKIKKTAVTAESISGTWSGKLYRLGYYIDFSKSQREALETNSGLGYIESPEDVKGLLDTTSDIAITISSSKDGKVNVALASGGDESTGLFLKSLNFFNEWTLNGGILTFQTKQNQEDYTELIINYGIAGLNNEEQQSIGLLISTRTFPIDPSSNEKTVQQIELYLTKIQK